MNSNEIKQLDLLQEKLEYKFENTAFLVEALTHPSMKQINKLAANYERMEFLGDSILGFLVTEMIFAKYQFCEEGSLAKIKAYLVSSEIIVKIANELDLSNYLIMTQGEERSGGRDNPNNIENAMEALIAAIYLDNNVDHARKIVSNLWEPFLQDFNLNAADPKSSLQEFLQKRRYEIPQYNLVKQEGASHAPLFTIEVMSDIGSMTGEGKSIKEAEKNAARKLLNLLESKE
jgi:ribonuclease III